MPRIRYRRSYDFNLYESTDEETFGEGQEEEPVSGNSWLSNATIASSLSDQKIKQAISALKAQITVLEAELLSRRLTDSQYPVKDWSEIGDLRGPEDGERLYPRPRRKSPKRRDKGNNQFQKVASLRRTLKKLGVADVNGLLDQWSKICDSTKPES